MGGEGSGGSRSSAEFEEAARSRVGERLPDADVSSLVTMLNLVRASNRIVGYLERAVHRPAGWSWAGFRAMFTLWLFEALEVRELARLSGMSRAATTSTLNTLERDGLIRRRRLREDARLVEVTLTPAGRQRLTEAYGRQDALSSALLRNLGDAERVHLDDALHHLLAIELDGSPGDEA
jgi:DNA-binding MarR family transcriptional regulator